jgi:antitoxin VapB
MSGRSQHVTIPAAFRFRSSTVSIRRDARSGDVILSEIPPLAEVFAALDAALLPAAFLSESDRDPRPADVR